MKKLFLFSLIILVTAACNQKAAEQTITAAPNQQIIGTWQLVYNEIREGDSVQVRDLSNAEFVKIINNTHFAFFNQNNENIENSYSGGGSYVFDGKNYTETLSYIRSAAFKDKEFSFTLEFQGDTLIQHGLEEVEEANVKRYIVEKYVKL